MTSGFLSGPFRRNLANAASLLWHAYKSLPSPSKEVNWAGTSSAEVPSILIQLPAACPLPSEQAVLGFTTWLTRSPCELSCTQAFMSLTQPRPLRIPPSSSDRSRARSPARPSLSVAVCAARPPQLARRSRFFSRGDVFLFYRLLRSKLVKLRCQVRERHLSKCKEKASTPDQQLDVKSPPSLFTLTVPHSVSH